MTPFKGVGPGKRGGWKRRKYASDGTVVEEDGVRLDGRSGPHGKAPGMQTRFHAHVNYSLTSDEAKRHGLKRTGDGGTYIPSERKLNEYLTEEKRRGREVLWREH